MYAANMTVNSSSACGSAYVSFCATTELISPFTIAFFASKIIFIIPFSTYVLYLGHQRWRQRSSKPATHSDVFTYHMAAIELIGVLGTLCYVSAGYANHSLMLKIGHVCLSIIFYGQIFVHLLTCLERYLAVVHPITYLGLKNARGAKIRNICTGCVWMLCIGLMCFRALMSGDDNTILTLCILVLSIIIMSFCCLSVLCVLIRPGPGEGGGKKVDQSKLRAFYTITATSAAVWLWFVGFLVSTAVYMSYDNVGSLVHTSFAFLSLPSNLVSPLLYLHRAGKLSCCCKNNE